MSRSVIGRAYHAMTAVIQFLEIAVITAPFVTVITARIAAVTAGSAMRRYVLAAEVNALTART